MSEGVSIRNTVKMFRGYPSNSFKNDEKRETLPPKHTLTSKNPFKAVTGDESFSEVIAKIYL